MARLTNAGRQESAKSAVVLDLLVGGAAASAVAVLGWLELELATTAEAADASIRELGTLLTVVFGAIAALWWNQSARLPVQSEEAAPAGSSQMDANILNAAAASFTALSLFCSVFAGSPWRSTGSWMSATAVLVGLTSSGGDVRKAVPITLRQRPLVREVLVMVLIALGAATVLWHIRT